MESCSTVRYFHIVVRWFFSRFHTHSKIMRTGGENKDLSWLSYLLQIWKCQPKSHILACTPSNSAADLITKRLLYPAFIPKSQVLRLHAMSRPWSTVPVEIKVHLSASAIILHFSPNYYNFVIYLSQLLCNYKIFHILCKM